LQGIATRLTGKKQIVRGYSNYDKGLLRTGYDKGAQFRA
jgi:hypothetical protein